MESTPSISKRSWAKFIPRYEPPTLPPMSVTEKVALLIGTGLSTGFMKPFAPSWGSIPGFGLFVLLARLPLWLNIFCWAALQIPAIWSGTICERLLARKDPRPVVIDEIAAVPLALWPLWFHWPAHPVSWFILFAIYRVMDFLKPWPANNLQSITGGLGILIDDLISSAYMGLGVAALLYFKPSLL